MLHRLQVFLARLRCPSFLQLHTDQHAQSLASCAFRRTLLLWLFAVYRTPSVRLVEDESWTRDEPSPQEMLRWLHTMVRRWQLRVRSSHSHAAHSRLCVCARLSRECTMATH